MQDEKGNTIYTHRCPHCSKIHHGMKTMRYCLDCRKLKSKK